MRPRVVLDTNVIVSGLFFSGPPRQIIALALEEEVEVATSAPLNEELERVLRTKFPHVRLTVQSTIRALTKLAVLTEPKEHVSVITDDPSDNRVLECALAAHADVIVSGDQHLLALRDFRGMPIFTPTAFLTHWRATRR